jgi:glycosyltransferase 2 family protein
VLATALGVALAALVIWVSHPDRVWSSLQQVEPTPLLLALLLNVPVVVLRAYRAQVIVAHLKHRVSMRAMLPIQLVGQTSSSLTPAASGDYVRAYLWRKSSGVPLRTGAAVVTFERLYSLFLLVAVSVLLISLPRHGVIGWVGVAAGLVLAAFAPLLFELMPSSLERWAMGKLVRGRFLGRFAEGAQGMLDSFRALMRAPVLLAWTSFITLAIFVAGGAQIWLVIDALSHRVPITQAVAAYATSQVAGILSTLPFGIGSADAILVTVFAGYGVTVSLAATVAVLLRAVTTLPQGLAGLAGYLLVEKPEALPAMEVE